ncbi:regulatory protein RecX [Kribbella flavida]|uniref:regulatory protein RecX n=1 Tax=Kribbella flavida TaxID=182640 RepID=UPI001ED90362|nr:regulatory protein RecX [Kribbella flavida]
MPEASSAPTGGRPTTTSSQPDLSGPWSDAAPPAQPGKPRAARKARTAQLDASPDAGTSAPETPGSAEAFDVRERPAAVDSSAGHNVGKSIINTPAGAPTDDAPVRRARRQSAAADVASAFSTADNAPDEAQASTPSSTGWGAKSSRPAQRRTRRFGSGQSRRGSRTDEPDAPADPKVDREADPHQVARTILLDKLSGQPRTRAELTDVLAEREIPDEVADEVLDRFTEVGLINDAAFATAWVESRHRGRGLGKRALAQELRRRGVDDELARDALEELDPSQEEATARALVQKKLRSLRSLDRQVAMRRLLGMLARKGYPGGLAMTVVKQELAASDEELPLLNDSGLEAD